uniref:Uncharacterized protein n=1 Tax=Balamuthia mandrillaris TaxID=66527 RepID=A0A0K1HRM2_9EUKA|nr:hypothetical protein [Balamuthia mandrillaris]AKT93867.1 hypothetical protein [Balamuthia mandrillaris]AKT94935.1 hypothetical protein [Balamuthia mandrillaris]AKT95001.1 hypothetical protein [Balamuthia mandrillaris]AKT95040.1 hypothetical protein [Balamuthia mandrillaris]
MTTTSKFNWQIYTILILFSPFLIFIEENFSVILSVLLACVLSTTVFDLILEAVRVRILALLYKFKYLYAYVYGTVYLNLLVLFPQTLSLSAPYANQLVVGISSYYTLLYRAVVLFSLLVATADVCIVSRALFLTTSLRPASKRVGVPFVSPTHKSVYFLLSL